MVVVVVGMANKHLKKCSTSLAIRKMRIKIAVRFRFTAVFRVAIMPVPGEERGKDPFALPGEYKLAHSNRNQTRCFS